MSNRPFIAARIESFVDRRAERFFRSLGWTEHVITYPGYGTEDSARVLGRVVLVPRWSDTQVGKAAEEFLRRRGWRNFFTAACVHAPYCVRVGDAEVRGHTDRGGYIDHRLRGHGLGPGWQAGEICSVDSATAPADVLVVANDAGFGLVSDLDDTVMATWLPRPLIAAYNSFLRTESARQAVPGMAVLYARLLDRHPGAPIVYVSTGAWNTQAFLRRFLARHRFPEGPMLLTDWGPTNAGWFRSGQAHKRNALLQLTVDFPNVRWLLVGDDGQHDPELYSEFARNNPTHVEAIAIRQLTPTEQILAHGTAEPIEQDDRPTEAALVVRAPDGRGLAQQLRAHGIL